MKMTNLLVFITVFAYAMIGNVSLADEHGGICPSKGNQLEYLIKNSQMLYEQDYKQYWKILRNAREKAEACTSQEATINFLKLAELRPRGAEFEEFFDESIESMITKKPNCFLAAMKNSSAKVRQAIIEQLHHPLTVEESTIINIFHNALSISQYHKLAIEFFNYNDKQQ